MTPDDQARALEKAMRDDCTILDDLPDKGWVSVRVESLVERIASALRATRPTWTDARPTTPGWYWWRLELGCNPVPMHIMICNDGSLAELTANGPLLAGCHFGGQWAKIEMPEDKP